MADSIGPQANLGAYVPSTNIWEVSRISQVDVNSEEFKLLLVRLYQNINNICIALNLKDTGYYVLEEFLNSQLFFPNPALDSTTDQVSTHRNSFRKVINFGALPNAGSKSVAHGITVTNTYSATRIYAAATNTGRTSFIPIPYVAASGTGFIELEMTNTDIIITTDTDRTDYILCYVIVEYIKT